MAVPVAVDVACEGTANDAFLLELERFFTDAEARQVGL